MKKRLIPDIAKNYSPSPPQGPLCFFVPLLLAAALLGACDNYNLSFREFFDGPPGGGGGSGAPPPSHLTLYVDQSGNDIVGNGTADAPFATMDKALAAIKTAYSSTWPNYRQSEDSGAPPAAARILVRGTITAKLSSTNALFDISDTGLYQTLPPVFLAGKGPGVNEGTLDAVNLQRVLYISKADVTLEAGLTLTKGCTTSGGGVYVNNGAFTMNGGTIRGNTSTSGGGGVYVNGGAFMMNGGTIRGNTANSSMGGGVSVGSGAFTMNGGTVRENTAFHGGGVNVSGGCSFNMSGGTISGNAASILGGGVYFAGTTFMMSGGTIHGNAANNNGGGVCVVSSGNFTKSGGTIYGDSDAVHTPDSTENTAGSGTGHAVYDFVSDKKRNSTAGPGVTLNNGTGDNWE